MRRFIGMIQLVIDSDRGATHTCRFIGNIIRVCRDREDHSGRPPGPRTSGRPGLRHPGRARCPGPGAGTANAQWVSGSLPGSRSQATEPTVTVQLLYSGAGTWNLKLALNHNLRDSVRVRLVTSNAGPQVDSYSGYAGPGIAWVPVSWLWPELSWLWAWARVSAASAAAWPGLGGSGRPARFRAAPGRPDRPGLQKSAYLVNFNFPVALLGNYFRTCAHSARPRKSAARQSRCSEPRPGPPGRRRVNGRSPLPVI